MTDHIEALRLSKDFLLSLRKYGGVDAVEWALDQLRWRDSSEKPDKQGFYLTSEKGYPHIRWWSKNLGWPTGLVQWWRPVTMPESTQTPSDGRDGV